MVSITTNTLELLLMWNPTIRGKSSHNLGSYGVLNHGNGHPQYGQTLQGTCLTQLVAGAHVASDSTYALKESMSRHRALHRPILLMASHKRQWENGEMIGRLGVNNRDIISWLLIQQKWSMVIVTRRAMPSLVTTRQNNEYKLSEAQ